MHRASKPLQAFACGTKITSAIFSALCNLGMSYFSNRNSTLHVISSNISQLNGSYSEYGKFDYLGSVVNKFSSKIINS